MLLKQDSMVENGALISSLYQSSAEHHAGGGVLFGSIAHGLYKLIGFGVGANQSLESSIIGSYQSVYPPKNTPAPVQQPLERRRFGNQTNQPAPMRDVQGECA
jgi:hypothetical protein